jgi:hypothetical protein
MVNIFNTQKPRDNFAPVPANVVAPMLIRVKRDQGSGDILTQSGSSDARYLNCEITITDGPHKGAKIFVRLVVEGSSDGAKTAQAISFGLIGSIVRSAMGVKSDDMAPAVEAKLSNFDFEALDRVAFVGKTGRIERGKLRDPSRARMASVTTTRRRWPAASRPTWARTGPTGSTPRAASTSTTASTARWSRAERRPAALETALALRSIHRPGLTRRDDEERADQRHQRRVRRMVEAGDRLSRRQGAGVDQLEGAVSSRHARRAT